MVSVFMVIFPLCNLNSSKPHTNCKAQLLDFIFWCSQCNSEILKYIKTLSLIKLDLFWCKFIKVYSYAKSQYEVSCHTNKLWSLMIALANLYKYSFHVIGCSLILLVQGAIIYFLYSANCSLSDINFALGLKACGLTMMKEIGIGVINIYAFCSPAFLLSFYLPSFCMCIYSGYLYVYYF